VLERYRVAEEVKNLDQSARAALRKYGVRFGAYHLYLPALLKPAPRVLAVHLWALKHDDTDLKGLDDVPHLAASGRTSIPVDKGVSKALYRTLGYRVCGERALRVDILERLADLIRSILSWRPGAPGERPAGAIDGSGFSVTVAMTSLTGSSGEDFASVLRSLGYRMERRPRPADIAAPPDSSPPSPATDANGAVNGVVPAAASDLPETPTESPAPVAGDEGAAEPVVAVQAQSEVARSFAAVALVPDGAERDADPAKVVAVDAGHGPAEGAAETTGGSAPSDQEPDYIEFWRPARPEERRPRRERPSSQRRGDHPVARHATRAETPPSPPAASPAKRDEAATRSAAGPRTRPSGPERKGLDRKASKRSERDNGPIPVATSARTSTTGRRDKQPDPNSPFAKLAALKEQLEANAKERG